MGLEKQLAQKRENGTSAVSVYAPVASINARIDQIIVANTAATQIKVRIFLDANGSTFDESTAIAWDIPIDVGSVLVLPVSSHITGNTRGNFGYRTDTANGATITIDGVENP